MRPRLVLPLAAALVALLATSFAPAASAKRHPPQGLPIGLTITAAPNPSTVGEPLAITGHLNASNAAGQTVQLWHRLAGQARYSPAGHTTTDAAGNYAFQRALGVVDTNRQWFVTSEGVRSPVWNQRVFAGITLAASTATALTNHVVTFSGHVTPNHRHELVFLQVQRGNGGDDWQTIDHGRLGRGSNYSIHHRFRIQDLGGKTLRVLFRGDRRNIRSVSNTVDINVAQAQNTALTIGATPSQVVTVGGSLTISGKGPASTPVALYARPYNGGAYTQVATSTTDATGAYSFAQGPLTRNTVYQVRTSSLKSAQLFVAVKDAVAISASSTSVRPGDSVTVSGAVAPDKSGHVIYLQELGSDGDWHLLQVGRIHAGSTYSFTQLLTATGTATLRAFVPGGPVNAGGASAPVAITVG